MKVVFCGKCLKGEFTHVDIEDTIHFDCGTVLDESGKWKIGKLCGLRIELEKTKEELAKVEKELEGYQK